MFDYQFCFGELFVYETESPAKLTLKNHSVQQKMEIGVETHVAWIWKSAFIQDEWSRVYFLPTYQCIVRMVISLPLLFIRIYVNEYYNSKDYWNKGDASYEILRRAAAHFLVCVLIIFAILFLKIQACRPLIIICIYTISQFCTYY